eukprot:5849461-Lingulodinium_polyedra.AAC.1
MAPWAIPTQGRQEERLPQCRARKDLLAKVAHAAQGNNRRKEQRTPPPPAAPLTAQGEVQCRE